ncbi:MAG: TlpA family protein disulfide reductase [Hyphomonadaceae bacterium]
MALARGKGWLKGWLLALGGALVLGGVLYVVFALAAKPDGPGLARFAKGEMAALRMARAEAPLAAQPFMDGEGRTRTLADFRGRIVVLNLWATWCPPCRAEMPTLAALARRYPAGDVTVLAISVDRAAERDAAEAMLRELSGGALDFYIDPTKTIAFAYTAPGFPTTYIIDREGREIARLAGDADWASPEAFALIDAALQE